MEYIFDVHRHENVVDSKIQIIIDSREALSDVEIESLVFVRSVEGTRTALSGIVKLRHCSLSSLPIFDRDFGVARQGVLDTISTRGHDIIILALHDQFTSIDSVHIFCFHIRYCSHRNLPFYSYRLFLGINVNLH